MVIIALGGPNKAGEGVSWLAVKGEADGIQGSEDRGWSYSRGGIISAVFKFGA